MGGLLGEDLDLKILRLAQVKAPHGVLEVASFGPCPLKQGFVVLVRGLGVLLTVLAVLLGEDLTALGQGVKGAGGLKRLA